MVIHESYITRKPLEFTLLVLFIILVILLPVYVYMEFFYTAKEKGSVLTETFNEVAYRFSPESDLSPADKRVMFRLEYEGNTVQWKGQLLSCTKMNDMYRVNVDHLGTGFADVVFTTLDDCSMIEPGQTIEYRMELVDWQTTTFIGKDGELISHGT
ncbi:hypothetical protein KY362_05840 [Candidatus Woesearchaeota archaeon]|nr:hypothetical protein [Candidatus Woesearchaeota archaeon]